MNLLFLYIIAGVMGLICLVALSFFIVMRFREREEPENQQIFENYMPQYSEGHTDGIIESIEFGEERIKIIFYPRDINYIKELNKDKSFKIKSYTIFYDKKQVIPLPIFSGHRAKIKAFPHRIDLLPEGLIETKYGKKIIEMINDNNELKDESSLLQMRLDNLQKIAKQTFGGEIYSNYVEKTKEQMKDLSENIKKDEKKFGDKKI